jgi:hypothetical protein
MAGGTRLAGLRGEARNCAGRVIPRDRHRNDERQLPQSRNPRGCCAAVWQSGVKEEGRSSFLKKRSKKLLRLRPCPRPDTQATARGARNKSFLLLFFKKEESSFLPPISLPTPA